MNKSPPHKWHFFFTDDALAALKAMQRGHRMAVFRNLRHLVNADAPYELDFVQALQGKNLSIFANFGLVIIESCLRWILVL